MFCILAHFTCAGSWLKCQLNVTSNFSCRYLSFIVQVKSCTFDEFQGISTVHLWWRQIVYFLMKYTFCFTVFQFKLMFQRSISNEDVSSKVQEFLCGHLNKWLGTFSLLLSILSQAITIKFVLIPFNWRP